MTKNENETTRAEWVFEDARGVQCRGSLEAVVHHGGSDTGYHFWTDTSRYVIVSGRRLRTMRNVTNGTADCGQEAR